MDIPDIKLLITTVKNGNRQEVKDAQKALESFWHNYYIHNRKEGKKAFEAFLPELKTFDQIKDIDHQAYFVSSLKWALWTIGEEYFDTWAEFLLKCIQHPSGKIRQAIIHNTDILIISLSDLPSRHKKPNSYDNENNAVRELLSIKRFGTLVLNVEYLLDKYYQPRYGKYKYVSSLPVGVYKSLQMLLTDKLLRSEYYKNIYNEFLRNLQVSRQKSDQFN
jgi:hypothetical protein